nr:hypothetical protein [Desulfurella multipotens]
MKGITTFYIKYKFMLPKAFSCILSRFEGNYDKSCSSSTFKSVDGKVAFFPALKGITGVLPQASYWLCWQDESLLFFPALKGITTGSYQSSYTIHPNQTVAFFPALKGITGVLPQASYWLCWQDESLLFFPALKTITTNIKKSILLKITIQIFLDVSVILSLLC